MQKVAPGVAIVVPQTGRMMLMALIAVGLIGGTLLMLPRTGRAGGLFAFLNRAPSPPAAEVEAPHQSQAASPGAPVAPPPAATAPPSVVAPAAPPAVQTPTAAPPAPQVPTAAEREEEAADRQFKSAVNLLNRRQTAPARQALQDVIQRYPATKTAIQARELLAQIPIESAPAPTPTPSIARTVPVPLSPSAAQPPLTLRERLEQERNDGRTLTTDDVAGSSRRSPTPGGRQVVIPQSLQGSRPAPVQSAANSARDDIRVASISQETGGLALNLEYRLATERERPVFVGAWVQMGTASRYFGYSPSPVSPGNGVARVLMPGATRDITSLRIAFFEEGGQRFFIKDVIVPK